MTDDLVQRLRRTYRKEYAPTGSMCGDNSNKPFPFPILATEVPVNPDGHEAADRIEALREALVNMRQAAAGFALSVRDDNGMPYPWPALDIADEQAEAALQETGQ